MVQKFSVYFGFDPISKNNEIIVGGHIVETHEVRKLMNTSREDRFLIESCLIGRILCLLYCHKASNFQSRTLLLTLKEDVVN